MIRAVLEAYQDPGVIALLANGELDLATVDPDVEWDASRLRDTIPDLAEVYWGHEFRRLPDETAARYSEYFLAAILARLEHICRPPRRTRSG